MTTTRTKMKLATVWLLHRDGREALGHGDAERAWDEAHALPLRSAERVAACNHFNPVEINIRLEDVDQAVAKWERLAGRPGVCHVETHVRRPGDTVQQVYV